VAGTPADWSHELGPRDVRGVSAEGKRWRYLGQFSASIVYEQLDAESAARLDAMMDRLCWADPGVTQ